MDIHQEQVDFCEYFFYRLTFIRNLSYTLMLFFSASTEEKYTMLTEKFNQYLEVYIKFPFASEYNNEHAKLCQIKCTMENTSKQIETIKKDIVEMMREISGMCKTREFT